MPKLKQPSQLKKPKAESSSADARGFGKRKVGQSTKPTTNIALREDSIRRLSDAAFQLFVQKGYHATTLDEIAKAANLTKGAIYFYFSSKQKLLLKLLDDAEVAVISPLLEHVESTEGGAMQKVAAFFRFSSQHGGIEQPEKLLCLIKTSIEFRDKRDEISDRIRQIYNRVYSALEVILEAGQKRGEIGKIPVRELASMIMATNDGMMLEWHRRGSQIDGRKLVRTVWTTFLYGIEEREMGALVSQAL